MWPCIVINNLLQKNKIFVIDHFWNHWSTWKSNPKYLGNRNSRVHTFQTIKHLPFCRWHCVTHLHAIFNLFNFYILPQLCKEFIVWLEKVHSGVFGSRITDHEFMITVAKLIYSNKWIITLEISLYEISRVVDLSKSFEFLE